jgi:molybdopterin-binding protein
LQLERQVRLAIADGVLQPGDRLPSVRATAARLGLATNTVARAYGALAREGILVTRPGGGTLVAPREALNLPSLARQRREDVERLTREFAVRVLALNAEPRDVVHTMTREFTRRGLVFELLPVMVTPVDDEPSSLSSRNQLRGTIQDIRGGEQIVEVRFRVRNGTEVVAVVTRASLERLGLRVDGGLIAHIKATQITDPSHRRPRGRGERLPSLSPPRVADLTHPAPSGGHWCISCRWRTWSRWAHDRGGRRRCV